MRKRELRKSKSNKVPPVVCLVFVVAGIIVKFIVSSKTRNKTIFLVVIFFFSLRMKGQWKYRCVLDISSKRLWTTCLSICLIYYQFCYSRVTHTNLSIQQLKIRHMFDKFHISNQLVFPTVLRLVTIRIDWSEN